MKVSMPRNWGRVFYEAFGEEEYVARPARYHCSKLVKYDGSVRCDVMEIFVSTQNPEDLYFRIEGDKLAEIRTGPKWKRPSG